jgi:hypothetical protein
MFVCLFLEGGFRNCVMPVTMNSRITQPHDYMAEAMALVLDPPI